MATTYDSVFQNFSTVQNQNMQAPVTIAAAATVAPVGFLTFLTGTTAVATITPPVSGAHMLCFVFTNASPGAFETSGNVKTACQPIENVPVFLIYDPSTGMYFAGSGVTSLS